jgi:hypothetical protein
MAPRGTKNRADALLAASLAAGATVAEAAAAAKVSERTVKRRLADPAFRALVDAEQDAIVERVVGCTAGRLGATLERLSQLVASQNETVALGACRATIEALLRLRAHATHSRRMSAIEGAGNEEYRESPDGGGEEEGGASDEPERPDGAEDGSRRGPDAGEGNAG